MVKESEFMGSPGILSSVLVVELFDDSRVNILCMSQTNVRAIL